jgi:hypothetical protein
MPEQASAEEQANAPVTIEMFNQLLTRLDQQSKYMARLEKQIGGKKSVSATEERTSQSDTNGDPPGLREQVAKLAQEQALIRQEREQLNRSKTISAIGRALQKKGINPLLADDAAEVAHNRNQAAFQLGADGEVTYEHNGESLTLDAWGSMFLATEKGSVYAQPKNGPARISLPRSVVPNPGKATMITPEQLASGDFDPALVGGQIAIAE